MKITVIKKASTKSSKPANWCPYMIDDQHVQSR